MTKLPKFFHSLWRVRDIDGGNVQMPPEYFFPCSPSLTPVWYSRRESPNPAGFYSYPKLMEERTSNFAISSVQDRRNAVLAEGLELPLYELS